MEEWRGADCSAAAVRRVRVSLSGRRTSMTYERHACRKAVNSTMRVLPAREGASLTWLRWLCREELGGNKRTER